MISASLAWMRPSICLMCSSVSFWTSFSARVLSSSGTFSSFLIRDIVSVRACRTAIRPSSASLCTTFTSSLRRSSERAGSGTRIKAPWVAGLRPRSASRMAFSMAWVSDLSNGCTVSNRASGAATMATWLSGIELP